MQTLLAITIGIAVGCSPLRNNQIVNVIIKLTGG
jgi:hypothetical protein